MSHALSRPHGSVSYENSGRVVLVTGGTNGIGAAIAIAFASSGAHVVVLDIDPPTVASREGIAFYKADTTDERECSNAIASAVEAFGGLDVLVNNAAIQPPESYMRIDEYPAELWQRMVDVNLTGYVNCAKHALKRMRQQRSGVIVNVASGQGHRSARGVPAYGPVKAANIMQARQWGLEYARLGIRVVSVSPGAIDTPLVRASLEKQGGAAELANRHPLGRIGRSEEVASAVLWLCSPGASFVTATDLEIDGGLGAFGAFADPYPLDAPPDR